MTKNLRLLAMALALGAGALTSAVSSPAAALEPWSDPDPREEWHRYSVGDFGFHAGAEYRAQFVYINPISLNTTNATETSWIEHRLRLDMSVDWKDKVRLVTSADVLDGVLWGDNGTYGGDPSSNSGANVNAKNPNVSKPCVSYRSGDPLVPDSYGYNVCPTNAFNLRKLYGEVVLPFGLLRVGRQSVNTGTGVQAADGDGRPNRFGVSNSGNYVDRVLFATKPLEAFKPKDERSLSPKEGLILALAYDRFVTDDPENLGAALNQLDVALLFLEPKHRFGSDLFASAYFAHRWDGQYATAINSVGARGMSRLGDFHVGFDVAANLGTTREVAQAYKFITNDPVVDQVVRQLGGRAVVRYDRKYFSLYLEGDYASGDPDPQNRTPLTQFTFAEDTNVGLLLFKRILAFQTARSAAAGTELLTRLGAKSFPTEAVATRGAFTDAIAIFPQVDVHPIPDLLIRGGALFAWAPAPVIDPVASLKHRDGLTIKDDLVNFAGGKPGSTYGTELDGRIQYRLYDHFLLDLEAAVLFPGNALQNRDGYAVRSGLFTGRTTFVF